MSYLSEMVRRVVTFAFCAAFLHSRSQTAADVAVQMTAAAQANQITLSWTGNGTTTQYEVHRKLKTANSWGTPLATLAGTVLQYADVTTAPNTNYEYRVRRQGTNYTGYGYLNAGFEVPETEFRGRLILIVDSSYADSIKPEIARLIYDIEGDGWEVIRHDVLRSGSVTHVKSLIANDYNTFTDVKAVFLLGHIPVPYSGNLNPDGHGDHLGAWPADVYYGEMNGAWSDNIVTSTTNSPPRTQNVPGDGKFDQSVVPGDVELQVGRVDMAKLTSFALTERQLLLNYLDKDHGYRKKLFTVQKRAVIDDNFGYFNGEAFAGSGYKNLSALVGPSNVTASDYFTTMSGNDYLWSYGCGGGSFTSAGGIGNTSNFASSDLQGVFTMLFGSYFGDWDVNNSFLRAPLAQGKMLTCMWSGRPHFQLHHMGLGENIGYGLIITQNNPGNVYFASPILGLNGKLISNALMGDPTLRNDIVAPVSNVVATKSGFDCVISWSGSPEPGVVGYHIYMKNDSANSYTRLNGIPVTSTSYTDYCLVHKGVYEYMVRAIKLETTTGGSYYNMSEGISDTAYNAVAFDASGLFSFAGGPVEFTFSPVASPATGHSWNFGDGVTSNAVNPVHTYSANGIFPVVHTATHACANDSAIQLISVTEVSLRDFSIEMPVVYPNPARDRFYFYSRSCGHARILTVPGAVAGEFDYYEGENKIDTPHLPKGVYLVECRTQTTTGVFRLVVE